MPILWSASCKIYPSFECCDRLLCREIEPFPKDFDYSPYVKTFVSDDNKDSEDTYTFKLREDRLILAGEEIPTECCLFIE